MRPRRVGARPRVTLGRALRSELLRLRRGPLVALHAVLALALGIAAGLYFGLTPSWDPLLGADALVQLVGAGAPLVAGISCGLAADAEREAGELANLLGVPARRAALAAKLLVLLALGAAAAAVACGLFVGVVAACGRAVPGAAHVAGAVAAMLAGSVASYALALAAALRWGRNAAIGLGALGLGVALACLGGLANGLVTGTLSGTFAVGLTAWVPFSWPARLASLVLERGIAGDASTAAAIEGALSGVGAACALVTAVLVACALVAAGRFEDRRRTGA